MKNFILSFVFLFLGFNLRSNPLPVKSHPDIIIDTDCALDDMRAICYLLTQSNIKIKAIWVSDGSLSPNEGVKKIKELLHYFKADSIPVFYGKALQGNIPAWRGFITQTHWGIGHETSIQLAKPLETFDEFFDSGSDEITLVCLGALTNVSRLIALGKKYVPKINRIVWYNNTDKAPRGFNYEYDKASADIVLNSGIRVDIIHNLNRPQAIFNTAMHTLSKTAGTDLGKLFYAVYEQPVVKEKLLQNHFVWGDELVAIYIASPDLFVINRNPENLKIRFSTYYDVNAVREVMTDMINGSYISDKCVVFNKFPTNREMFTYDVRQIIDTAIAKYGLDEWKANVMTDEFHGHLGVFSIVGAKMGIRAREWFNVGPDELRAISFAGTQPPYSCLNDGIQVSTGATLGMGTIEVSKDSLKTAAAIFSFNGKSVKFTLKPEYLKQVQSDIREGIVKFGLADDGYWKLIRKNALKYWVEWDRKVIFDIEEIK